MATTLNAATFMGKNFLDNQNSIMNSTDLTLKHMFDITAKLVGEQEEINNVDKIHWEKLSWKHLSLIGDETVINLQRAKVYVFSDSVLCLGRVHQHPESNEAWKKRIEWIINEKSYRDYDGINGESTEFAMIRDPIGENLQRLWWYQWRVDRGQVEYFPRISPRCSSAVESPIYWADEEKHHKTFTGRILFMSMFNDISCDKKHNEEKCVANAKVVSILARKFGIGQWSFIGPGSEKKWYSMEENSPQGIWDHIAEKMLLEFAESGCPIFRATTPFSRCKLKSKGHGKLSIHFAADQETIETIFRIIAFSNQLSLHGAVANMCEEFESLQDRPGQPDVLMGQSIVLSEIKAEVPLDNNIPSHQNLLLQRYEEWIEILSQENKVSKICMDAGFIHVVEIGQYFMTKDTGEQFFYEGLSWIHSSKKWRIIKTKRMDSGKHENWTRIGNYDQLSIRQTWNWNWNLVSEWRQLSILVRISHGSNKFVIDSNHNNTEVPADLPEEQASQLKMKDFAVRSKAKAKPQRREPVDLPSIIPMKERKWIDIEPGNYSLSAYEISKNVINLLRHSQTVQREDDGAVQFWRIKNYLRNQFPQVQYWSDDRWKLCLAAGGGAKRRYWYFRNNCLSPSSSRTFRTQSHWSFITGQCDNSEWILPTYLPYWMCF